MSSHYKSKRPSHGVDELLRVAEVVEDENEAIAILSHHSKPQKTFPKIEQPTSQTAPVPAERPVRSVRQSAPESERTARVRREKPLNTSTLPPLNWLDALDKYCPLP